jgi:hypothetical protein
MVEIPPHFIPFDKSWLIRLGVLDLLHDRTQIDNFLEEHQAELSSDLIALQKALVQWRAHQPIDVGESATLYRFLQFAAWSRGEARQFIKHGTLCQRSITDDPRIVKLPLTDLLALDNGTSQWASAAVLAGNTQPPPASLPFKLDSTYQALAHWQSGGSWQPRRDITIAAQAQAYLTWRQTGGKITFTPHQAEDYCFARAFGLITSSEGEKRWPSLHGHESDRIAEMEQALRERQVISDDHRVIQAIAMRRGKLIHFTHPAAVAKSWPQFWDFLDWSLVHS